MFGGPRAVRTDLFAAIALPVLTLFVLLYTFVFNAPLQNVGFLILQRWVFNFGTLGFLFVFFIRQLYNHSQETRNRKPLATHIG